jgi:hypothetical protein
MRAESEVFAELQTLCASPGYAHVIAYFCQRDSSVVYDKEITPQNLTRQFSTERLIRTEVSTLIGLMSKVALTLALPHPDSMQMMIDRTETLLQEMHDILAAPLRVPTATPQPLIDEIPTAASGDMLREPIFYSGESAYEYQFREFAQQRYLRDAAWIQDHKGFTIVDAAKVAGAAMNVVSEQMSRWLPELANLEPDRWNWLPIYRMRLGDLAAHADLSPAVVSAVVNAFACECRNGFNDVFDRLSEFNETDARPFLKIDDEEFILFQPLALSESIYDSPLYWMLKDESYKTHAMQNRGQFAEDFCTDRLAAVFGEDRVHKNVVISTAGGHPLGEIDILVVFANRAIVVQTKSKRLTIEARKGIDQALRLDFAKGIQSVFDQGLSCAKYLREGEQRFVTGDGTPLVFAYAMTDIFIFCVVSDSYPALAYQTRHLLHTGQPVAGIATPLVTDIFLLDVLCEVLSRPLLFLSYVAVRARIGDQIVATHEIVILGFFLKTAFPGGGKELLALQDDVGIDLDIAMAARRTGMPGASIPPGLLPVLASPRLNRLMTDIERMEEPATVDFAFLLLSMGIRSIEDFSPAYEQMFEAGSGLPTRDVTLRLRDSGVTAHTNALPEDEAAALLHAHCERRKYLARATSWYGIGLTHDDGGVRFGMKLEFPWAHSDEMDSETSGMDKGYRTFKAAQGAAKRKGKIGRQDRPE